MKIRKLIIEDLAVCLTDFKDCPCGSLQKRLLIAFMFAFLICW